MYDWSAEELFAKLSLNPVEYRQWCYRRYIKIEMQKVIDDPTYVSGLNYE